MKKGRFGILIVLIALIFLSVPVIHILKTQSNESDFKIKIPYGYTDDASGLNLTKVDTIIKVATTKNEIVNQLRSILTYAKQNNKKISIAGARHSMGGHTIYPDGIVLNMLTYNHMEIDTVSNILTVGSGALWENALQYLDKFHKSIAIMQAFSSFSVGGSISVNGHGWQKDLPPIASSIISFTLMNDEGEILNCSRNENPGLFKLVIGGYGLFWYHIGCKTENCR
jgi:FAD/FMN-containing dehydrogenase